MIELYRNIRDFRKAAKMSQDELAKKTGYTDRSSIAKIESGQVDLPQSKIALFASALGVTASELMGNTGIIVEPRKIPVLGRVAAGVPIEMIEDIVDEVEIPGKWEGEHFGLVIHGDSMEPKISDGDIVIVKKQDYIDNGQIGIITVNGEDATCKHIFKYADTLVLRSNNPKYEEMVYTKEQVEALPVRILGRVVELRAKF